jgi:hypothetical protein
MHIEDSGASDEELDDVDSAYRACGCVIRHVKSHLHRGHIRAFADVTTIRPATTKMSMKRPRPNRNYNTSTFKRSISWCYQYLNDNGFLKLTHGRELDFLVGVATGEYLRNGEGYRSIVPSYNQIEVPGTTV